jgi:chromosome segregation protein
VRLTSIKLSGFKSFVDPANFQVPGSLVGVVGPNGCGKSNIIDAVRWVLGESKASELRGESMQDVIFNGTTNRKPAGRASVELVFDNGDGKAAGQWSQYAEVAVKRTLTRDGTSSYYINNQPVRRRDIQDIFLGTGLGPRAYAIIGQGMISRIIEARPEDLRIFLEEAAGVSKYKERRRETENRLQDTRENLQRIDDILRELNANLEKLQSQAAVARQYHALQGEQSEKQKLLWLVRRNEARAEQQKLFRDIELAQAEMEEQAGKLQELEQQLEGMRQQHYAAGDKLHQAQGHLYQTNSEIGGLEAQIRFVAETRNRLQTQLITLKAQRENWQGQHDRGQEDLAEAEMGLEELAAKVGEAEESAQRQQGQLPELETAWRDAQAQSAESKRRIMATRQQIELEAAHQRNASNQLSGLAARRERLAQEKSGLQAPDAMELEELRLQLEEANAGLDEARLQLEDAQERQPQLEDAQRQAQARVNAESAENARLEARLQALKQLQERVQAQGKVAPWLKKHGLDGLPRLWQRLEIEEGWETALEAVLRERSSALEVSNIELARGFLADAPPGKMALYSTSGAVPSGPAAAAGLTPALSLLHGGDAGLRALMADWLAHVYLADDIDAALAQRASLPAGAVFVTRAGHLVGAASVAFHAADSEQDGMLARQHEIDSIGRQLKAQALLAEEGRAAAVQADAARGEGARRLQELRQHSQALTQKAHALQIETMKAAELQERFRQRSERIGDDLSEIAEQEAEQNAIRAEAEARLEQLDMELAELQEGDEGNSIALQEAEQRLNDARQRLRELERAAQASGFAERAERSRIEELRRSIATASEQLQQLAEAMRQGESELAGLDDDAAREGMQSLLDRRSEQEHALADARHELDALTQKLRHLEEARMKLERGLQPQRERITELQLKEQAARLAQEQYAQQLLEAEADEAQLAEKLVNEPKPSWLQGEVTRLTNAIAALGPVNLAALEELEQATERKTFLDAQVADLSEAIATLEDAIHKIDRETRELLQDTFDKVNHHFGTLFPALFGGGNARLIMTGDEILDAGVQVMAQPPGKKNATIHLLSGGEKALTATALVFAMFQLNPAPFCLLDEVDAPLDDANTERFCNMVKRMSAQTQFLFISHNRIAMEMAQQLIGVTMQEQGVSRIVAVDLQSAAGFADEARAA